MGCYIRSYMGRDRTIFIILCDIGPLFILFYLSLYLGFYLYGGVCYLYGGDGFPLPVLGDVGYGHADEVVEEDEVLTPVLLHDVAHAGTEGFHKFKDTSYLLADYRPSLASAASAAAV